MKITFLTFIIPVFLFTACRTGSKTTVEKILTTQRNIMPPDSIIQKQKNGIDLYATGDFVAYWTLEIDFDNKISFRSADGTSLDVLPNFEKKEISSGSEKYIIQTNFGAMKIDIYNSSCSGKVEQFGKKVDVTLKNKTYTGCGKYLFDHRINDIWELESINNETQKAADFQRGLPILEFNLQENNVNGSDGCNKISSTIEMKGNRIKFSPFSSTKMACNKNKAEKIFNELLSNKLVDYYLENNKLIMYLEDDSKLYFIRKNF
jgi:heat shock protein HslJ